MTYRVLLDGPIEMPRIRTAIDLIDMGDSYETSIGTMSVRGWYHWNYN
jgi:hypothetical protein